MRSVPYTSPSAKEFVIKDYAWAINPVDWVLQDNAHITWLNYPLISGEDVASEVFEVVSNVTRFEVGDRVLAAAIGLAKNEPSGGGFQAYDIVEAGLTAPIPEGMK